MMYVGSLGRVVLGEEKEYRPSKASIMHYYNPKTKGVGYYGLKVLDKAVRPIVHVGDYIGKGIDYVGDKIMETRPGKLAHEYLFDPEGKHPVARAALVGGLTYGLNRAQSHAYNIQDSKVIHGLDIGTAAVYGHSAAMDSAKRGAMKKERLKALLKKQKEDEIKRRKERDIRINSFWKDMTY